MLARQVVVMEVKTFCISTIRRAVVILAVDGVMDIRLGFGKAMCTSDDVMRHSVIATGQGVNFYTIKPGNRSSIFSCMQNLSDSSDGVWLVSNFHTSQNCSPFSSTQWVSMDERLLPSGCLSKTKGDCSCDARHFAGSSDHGYPKRRSSTLRRSLRSLKRYTATSSGLEEQGSQLAFGWILSGSTYSISSTPDASSRRLSQNT